MPLRWGRVFAAAVPLIVLNCGWIANSEMKTFVTEVTISSLFMGVTFILFLATLLNLLVQKLGGSRAGMRPPELMALYVLLSISSVVAGVGHFGFFLPFLANAFFYALPSNGWHAFWYLIPSAVGPRDPAVLKGFYDGRSTFLRADVLAAWAPPLLFWGAFFLLLLWTTLCLSAMLRRRWADEEHLPFPVIALPLEMVREGAPLYRSRLLWLGFAVPVCLHSLNSLQSLYPTLPTFPVNSAHDFVAEGTLSYPWTGTATLFHLLHPSGVGFGYLVNTDVSFSLWFFYLLKKAVSVWGVTQNYRDVSTSWGADASDQFPFIGYQGWGAFLTLGAASLWAGRASFFAYVRRAFRGDPRGVDRGEPMSARLALFGFTAGSLGLCAFVWTWGGSWWLPVVFLGLYLLVMVTLSRIRAEMAVVSCELGWISPQSILTTTLGTSALSHADLAHTASLSWFNLDYRAAGMPHELEGFVALNRTGARVSPLVPALLAAAALAMLASAVWDLQLYYANGAAQAHVNSWRIDKGSEPWHNLESWLHSPKAPNPHALPGMAVGAGITLALSAMRARFVGFPLQPAAYALNMSFANDLFWCDMFVAWVIKACVLRYGGLKLYRQALPLFLGLILGDFVTGSVWSIIGTLLHVQLFRTFAT